MEWVEVIKDVICTVGFPIVVTGFLLFERMPTTKELIKTISSNTAVIEKLLERLDK